MFSGTSKNSKILIIIPTFNEQDCIEAVVNNLRSNYSMFDYVVIDDKSTDNTKKVLDSIGANYISLPVNLGIGGAVQTGYQYAVEHDYDIAIQMDGDGQHDPAYLNSVIDPIVNGEADICIGSRFIKNEGFQSSRSRRLGIKLLSSLVFLCLHKKYFDVTSGYRAVGKPYIALYAREYPQDYPEPEAIVTGIRHGARIREIPVVMRARESGKSSINIKRSIYYMGKVSLALLLANFMYRKSEDKKD